VLDLGAHFIADFGLERRAHGGHNGLLASQYRETIKIAAASDRGFEAVGVRIRLGDNICRAPRKIATSVNLCESEL
jgi:hypothetical protein